MSQTTSSRPPDCPLDILMQLVVAFLAPMFLAATGGDIGIARAAAAETVDAYRARTHAELISIAQIIAFGLGALGSLSLAMAGDIPPALALRLRGNANACNRSAEQHRRALQQSRPDAGTAEPASRPLLPDPNQDAFEAEVVANVAATRQRAAEARTRAMAPPPAPAPPAPPAAAVPASSAPDAAPAPTRAAAALGPNTTEQQWQAIWASAMADVAAEYTADIASLPPGQRRAASLRAAALNGCATDLLAGNEPPRLTTGAITRGP
jgi:hypothetical protein